MSQATNTDGVEAVRNAAHPLSGAAQDYDPLLERIGDARVVLMGEATHGTHEFYRARAEITKRLIREKGFSAVAVEADWPDAYRVNRYVRGIGADQTGADALGAFTRFPLWMWRNADVLDFVGWLRDHNDALPAGDAKVGFYGLDLYSLHASITEVVGYLDKVDPEAARRARSRYSCFEHFGEDPQAYGLAATFGRAESCEDEVVDQLVEMQRSVSENRQGDGQLAEDEYFYAEQNARLAKNAEEYYRSMFRGRVSSWNIRDTHMADTLDALMEHLGRRGSRAKVVVWAHNSHIGDASATELGEGGELNVGQLARERHGDDAVLVGFSTYTGTVTAATEWDMPGELRQVRQGLAGSYEALFHDTGIPRFLLLLGRDSNVPLLREWRLERAIGVIYLPETERRSHYFHARLADQFDAVIHFDQTRAVEPLEHVAGTATEEAPETFPSAL